MEVPTSGGARGDQALESATGLSTTTTLSSEVLAAIIAPIVALALAIMCILVMVVKERSGTPMFSTLAVNTEKVTEAKTEKV